MRLLDRILLGTSLSVHRLAHVQILCESLDRARSRHNGGMFAAEAAKIHGGLPRLLRLTAMHTRLTTAIVSSASASLVDTELGSLPFCEIVPLFEQMAPVVCGPIIARWGDQDLAYRLAYNAATREMVSGSPMARRVESLITGVDVPNHYVVLGIPRAFCPQSLKESYRRLAWTHHPDRVAHMPRACHEDRTKAEDLMQDINHSYEVLAEPTLHATYELQIPVRANLYPPAPWFRWLRELGVTTHTPDAPSGSSTVTPTHARTIRKCIGPVAALPRPTSSARFS